MADQLIFDHPFVAYDGSSNCSTLVEIYKEMYDKFDDSTFIHVWNPDKNYIPPPCKGPQIGIKLQEELGQCKKNITTKLIEKPRTQKKTVNQLLLESYFGNKCSFLMCGFYGSKGQKVRKQDLSSRVSRFVYDSKLPIAVIKKPLLKTNTVGYCCDGSDVSFDGLTKCIVFCKKFGYILKILHCYNQSTKSFSKTLKNQLKGLLSDCPVKSQIIMEQSCNVVQSIKCKQGEMDWLFMTRNGYRGQISKKIYVGATTSNLLIEIDNNIVIVS